MRLFLISLSLISNFTFGQSSCRKNLTAETNAALTKLDSFLNISTSLEFRSTGKDYVVSEKYKAFEHLEKIATENEFLALLADSNERPAMRGYAYIGYLEKCQAKNTMPEQFNYSFTIHTVGRWEDDLTFPIFVERMGIYYRKTAGSYFKRKSK